MARQLIAFKATDAVSRIDNKDGEDILTFEGEDFGPRVAYPEDYVVAEPSPSQSALNPANAIPPPVDGPPAGVDYGLTEVGVSAGQLAEPFVIEGPVAPPHIRQPVSFAFGGARILSSFKLPAALSGLSGTGGGVFTGLTLPGDLDNSVLVGIEEASSAVRAVLRLKIAGATVYEALIPLSASGGAGQWCHLIGDVHYGNISGETPLGRLYAMVGTDSEIGTKPTWGTKSGPSGISEANWDAFLAILQGGNPKHVFTGNVHSVDEFDSAIGAFGVF